METIEYRTLQGFIGKGLSFKELQYTLAVACGLTDKQIAKEVGVAPDTVSKTVHRAMCKLKAMRRADLVMKAMAGKIIAPLAVLLMVCSVTNGAVPDMERAPRGRVKITRTVRNSRRDDLLDNIFDYV